MGNESQVLLRKSKGVGIKEVEKTWGVRAREIGPLRRLWEDLEIQSLS